MNDTFGFKADLKQLHALRPDDPTIEVEEGHHEEETAQGTASKEAPSKVTVSNIFQHPDTHPFALDMLLHKKYGVEYLLWEGETLELRIPIDFHSPRISDLNIAKIQAMRTLHLTDAFWERWEVFNWCTMPLNSLHTDFEVLQVPTAIQCLIACDIAHKVRKHVDWSSEVKTFISTVFLHDGLLYPLAPCDFVEFDSASWVFNPQSLLERWPEVLKTGNLPKGDTIVDEQLRRIWFAKEALEKSRAELRTQLRLVDHVRI